MTKKKSIEVDHSKIDDSKSKKSEIKTQPQETHLFLMRYFRSCWKCGEGIPIYFIQTDDKKDLNPDQHPEIVPLLLNNTNGIVQKRFSHTMDQETIVNVCPKCDNIQGNWYVFMDDDWIARSYGDCEVELVKDLGLHAIVNENHEEDGYSEDFEEDKNVDD